MCEHRNIGLFAQSSKARVLMRQLLPAKRLETTSIFKELESQKYFTARAEGMCRIETHQSESTITEAP